MGPGSETSMKLGLNPKEFTKVMNDAVKNYY